MTVAIDLLVLLIPAIARVCLAAASTDEQVVHEHIKDRLMDLPDSINEHRGIDVKISFKLNQIIDIDERQQILTTSIFFKQTWLYPSISWENISLTTVNAIRLLERSVWIPDTYVFNNADDLKSGFLAGLYVLVTRCGEVHWPIRAQLKTFCPMDIRMFPFDVQTCEILIGSWIQGEVDNISYSLSSQSETLPTSVDLSDYTDNSDWILVSALMLSTPSNGIKIVLTLQRRSFYYIWILIVPFVMLTILSLLTFCMPSTSNEKLSLSLSVFMAFSMFMIMISERIPPSTEDVPLIGVYLATVMTMAAASILVTVLSINIYQRGGFQRPAKWLRTICIIKLAPMLNLKRNKVVRDNKVWHNNSLVRSSRERSKCFDDRVMMPFLIDVVNMGATLSGGRLARWPSWEGQVDPVAPSEAVAATSRQSPESVRSNKSEWELIAVVLDNMSFYIFVVAYLLVYCIIFLTPVVFGSSSFS